jgi:hypothetical protein
VDHPDSSGSLRNIIMPRPTLLQTNTDDGDAVARSFINQHNFQPLETPVELLSDYHHIIVTQLDKPSHPEFPAVCSSLLKALELREKFMGASGATSGSPPKKGSPAEWSTAWHNGVVQVSSGGSSVPAPPTYEEFASNLKWLNEFVFSDSRSRALAKRRLEILEMYYSAHVMMNNVYETEEMKSCASDFNTAPKVDNHIHAAAAMTAAEFLRFLRTKVATDGSKVVMRKNGEESTLQELLTKHCRRSSSAMVQATPRNPSAFNADALDMQATVKVFQRFDNFNDTYNPFG